MFASRLRCAVACTALVVLPRLLLETGMLEILVHSQFWTGGNSSGSQQQEQQEHHYQQQQQQPQQQQQQHQQQQQPVPLQDLALHVTQRQQQRQQQQHPTTTITPAGAAAPSEDTEEVKELDKSEAALDSAENHISAPTAMP
ncbi:unnamed protein product, partial [Polarella glacialis]